MAPRVSLPEQGPSAEPAERTATRPARMRALVLSAPVDGSRRGRLDLTDLPTPVPGPAEVLVRVALCGICGTDVHVCRFHADGTSAFGGPVSLPVVLGHEASGVVARTGEWVTRVRPGDLVALESVLACGTCDTCLRGRPNQCERVTLTGLTAPGALAEYVVVPQTACHRLEPLRACGWGRDEALQAGALLEPLGCVYNALFVEGGGVRPGEHVTVHGLGPLGLFAGLLCRVGGASRVVGLDPLPERRDLARRLGFTACLDPADPPPDLLDADLHVEASGNPAQTLPVVERHLRPAGRCVVVSRTDSPVLVDTNPWVSTASRLIGARGHSGGIFPYLINLFASGQLDPRALIGAVLTLDQVPGALAGDAMTAAGKTLVRITGTPVP
ncbi:alcohol dehydrogenase catalytic domain-containing protein [Actinosynnema sp. NPDC047251]|uniref:Alcohol dehydrogenase n=1 Tax=Saccharothrix espanaensis (strain ATCC 51144 / DSM 44229 / JCM 9112 / NBRC 15066 / NRRL 15764) TaxID=1179773 RepID=K0K445_SACES|nr:alcohol dehydrogenase catalytic domain-containing protein [Saccharothrix espanaensis]CCH32377.1 Alcohol dehydrogenase [Saccharothrix espanaensis DSM 44229]